MTTNPFCTPRLGLPLMAPAQASKHIIHNEALMVIDGAMRRIQEGGLPSACLNGGFHVWQRGDVFTEPGSQEVIGYCADRWAAALLPNEANRVERRSAAVGNAIQITRTTGSSDVTSQRLVQPIDTNRSRGLAGTRVVLSFLMDAGADFSAPSVRVRIFAGNGTDEGASALLSDQWVNQRVLADGSFTPETGFTSRNYVTADVPALADGLSQIGIRIDWQPTGIAGADDGLSLADIRLQIAYSPAPLAPINPAAIHAECHKFFQRRGFAASQSPVAGVSQHYETFTAISSNALRTFISFEPEMRSVPNISFFRGGFVSGPDGVWNVNNGNWDSGQAMTLEQIRLDGMVIEIVTSAPLITGFGGAFLCNGGWTSDCELH